MEKSRRNIAILCVSLVCIAGVTFCLRFLKHIDVRWLRIAALVGLNLLNGLIAFAAMKLTRMPIKLDWKNVRQYGIGALLAVALSLVIAVIPAVCGFSLVGGHSDFSWFSLLYELLFCFLIVGPVEEFVFRVYLQDAFVGFFPKHTWLGVVIAAFLFGCWHLINGSFMQMLFTFGIGLAFGFTKHKIKGSDYFGLAFGHGLYDFLNAIVRMFII